MIHISLLKKRMLTGVAGLFAIVPTLQAAPGDTISLDEKWLFKMVRNKSAVPRDVESVRFNDSQWTFQTIPSVWRVPTAWAKDDYVGTYRGWVKMPPAYAGRRIFLHMGFTTASTTVYVNGEKIGVTAADRAQTEFEITSNVKVGQRNLLVFQMPHYDEGENATNTYGNSGITSPCFVYALASGQQQDRGPAIGKAKAGVRVASRRSFELAEGFFDTPALMKKDIDLMKGLGIGAITYDKLSSDPAFIAFARTQGMEVVSDAPVTTGPLVDAQGNYTLAVYDLLPESKYNFKKEIKEGEDRADAVVSKPKPRKKEDDDVLTIWDTPYSITFDKYTGLVISYVQNGVAVFSGGGTVMPNAKTRLVSLTSTKPNKNDVTKVTAVYDVEGGGQVTWVYEIGNNGVLSVEAKGGQDIQVTLSSRLNQSEYLAQDFGKDATLVSIRDHRPQVYWMKQRDHLGNGVQVIGERPFTALETAQTGQLLIQHGGKDFRLRFLPVSR